MMKSFTVWLTYERGLWGRFTEAAFSPGSRGYVEEKLQGECCGRCCCRRAIQLRGTDPDAEGGGKWKSRQSPQIYLLPYLGIFPSRKEGGQVWVDIDFFFITHF